MALLNFIPDIWSETLLSELDREYIGVRNCNRDYEGEIREKGSSVIIGSIGNISVFDYDSETDISAPESITDNAMYLAIDQSKAFNFYITDIERAQAVPGVMKAAMKKAAAALADVADKYVYGFYSKVMPNNTITAEGLTADNVLDYVIAAKKKLLANGVNSNTPTSLEVSPDVAAVLLRAKILNQTDNSEAMENGLLGRLVGLDIYVSPNVHVDGNKHKCIIRTKRAMTFAEQLNEVEAYRPESKFADAVKGLHLYGAKIVYPDEFLVLDATIA